MDRCLDERNGREQVAQELLDVIGCLVPHNSLSELGGLAEDESAHGSVNIAQTSLGRYQRGSTGVEGRLDLGD